MDTSAFENLSGRVLRTVSPEKIKSANTQLELIGLVQKEFFAKRRDARGGDFITSTGKSISELLSEHYERNGMVGYMEEFEPMDYKVEAVVDKEGAPTAFVIHQYRTKEKANERTTAVNQHRAELADRLLQQTLMQFRFLRQLMRIPGAPSFIHPTNFKIEKNGALRVAYITSKGTLRMKTPAQIDAYVKSRGKPKKRKGTA